MLNRLRGRSITKLATMIQMWRSITQNKQHFMGSCFTSYLFIHVYIWPARNDTRSSKNLLFYHITTILNFYPSLLQRSNITSSRSSSSSESSWLDFFTSLDDFDLGSSGFSPNPFFLSQSSNSASCVPSSCKPASFLWAISQSSSTNINSAVTF